MKFHRSNLQQIKYIFQEKTGVALDAPSPRRRPAKWVLATAAALVCLLALAGFTFARFSALAGDELGLSAEYRGNGVVAVTVENRSDKQLTFQPVLKLMRWRTGEEIAPGSGSVSFTNTSFAPHEKGVMTIDLSGAYDMAALEEPLTDDAYYFVLTNNHFVFGQDWMCSVRFSEVQWTSPGSAPPVPTDSGALEAASEALRGYFAAAPETSEERQALEEQYVADYTALLDQFPGHVVFPVDPEQLTLALSAPVTFDNTLPQEEQDQLWSHTWTSRSPSRKLLAAAEDHAIGISAYVPDAYYPGALVDIPILYLFTYEKAAVDPARDYAFLHGQIISFAQLDSCKVYEDERYICYEVSGLIYADLETYIQSQADSNPHILYNSRTVERVTAIYNYFKENLSKLVVYREDPITSEMFIPRPQG